MNVITSSVWFQSAAAWARALMQGSALRGDVSSSDLVVTSFVKVKATRNVSCVVGFNVFTQGLSL